MEHKLFITTEDPKIRDINLTLLRFIHNNLGIFRSMGIIVRVSKVRRKDLSNIECVKSMKANGITRLPAMVVNTNNAPKVLIGAQKIISVYTDNINAFKKTIKGGATPSPEDALGDFYASEMVRPENEKEDVAIGEEGKGMMKAYDKMMNSRDSKVAKKPGSIRPAEREDNVRHDYYDGPELDTNDVKNAFMSQADEDGVDDPKDAMMQRAYAMNTNFDGDDDY
jgi:hypothetical protein